MTPSFETIPDQLREEIESLVEQAVDQRLLELLGDPDEGLVVRDEVLDRLREQQKRVAGGERGRPMDTVFTQSAIDVISIADRN